MPTEYNIYCDESCHLEHDGQRAMTLGGLCCPKSAIQKHSRALRQLKTEYGLDPHLELKWTKVSPGRQDLYHAVLDYFLSSADLRFRAVVVPDKKLLRHQDFDQDHDTFYYKMYFEVLRFFMNPSDHYSVYLDVKDTRSSGKAAKLREILSASLGEHRSTSTIVRCLQMVRSHESELIQLTDLLTGIISYANRHLHSSATKTGLARSLSDALGWELCSSTPLSATKVNIFVWEAK